VNRSDEFTTFEIAGRRIGGGSPAFIVAEVAQAHDGSLGLAHAYIDAAADHGADAVKFQTHIADAESTLDEPFRVPLARQDETRYDYWRRMQFTAEQWSELAAHARQRGIQFLSTAFSVPAVELLRKIGMPAWKVGSGEFRLRELIDAMAQSGVPILYSTGMAGWSEIADAVGSLRAKRVPHALLQCTSKYPTPLEEVGLNLLERLRDTFACPVGLSDHSGSVAPGFAAIARGADLLEVHVTFDRATVGPDVSSSVTFEQLESLCAFRDAVAVMDAHPVDKDKMAESLRQMRTTFGRSLAPVRKLAAGTRLAPDMLMPKKPAGGIPPEAAPQLAGRELARDVSPDRILRWEDLAGGRE
jgi:N,N'-diacetyllegionaminate synthase